MPRQHTVRWRQVIDGWILLSCIYTNTYESPFFFSVQPSVHCAAEQRIKHARERLTEMHVRYRHPVPLNEDQ